jgi:hypothetical protein
VSLKDGSERLLSTHRWALLKQVAWLHDGSGLIMVGRSQTTDASQV